MTVQRFPSNLPKLDIYSYEEYTEVINSLFQTLYWISPLLNSKVGQVEPPPEYKRVGLLCFADGAAWNPGSGQGYYRYTGTAWSFVG